MTSQPDPTCVVVQSDAAYRGKQGGNYFPGISAATAGSRELCLHLATIPPGARARAHLHEGHETAMYILSGAAEMWFGDELEHHLIVKAGDYLYIPAGMPHLPANLSETEPCVVILARTDPNEQESVVLRPDLEARPAPSTHSLNGN